MRVRVRGRVRVRLHPYHQHMSHFQVAPLRPIARVTVLGLQVA